MSDISLNTTIRVDEDTARTFNIRDILAKAGYTTPSGLEIISFVTELPDGEVVETDTSLLGLVDSDTLYVRPGAWEPHYNGEFTTYQFIITQGNGSLVSLQLQVIIDPVNDAPSAKGRSFILADHDAVVLKESDFGFKDVVEGHGFESVIITSLPLAGRLVLGGVDIAAGAELAISDIRAGKLSFVPDAGSGGIVDVGFQVRDNGGMQGTGADDTSDTSFLSFKVPVPVPPPLATLGDRVWEDRDADGVQDAGEAGLAGVTVELRDAAGNLVKTTTTDADGHYGFDIAGGTYTVAVTAPAGYLVSAKGQGSDRGADSDMGANGRSGSITLAPGATNDTVDAGLYRTAAIDSQVWNDADRDGRRDAGEEGLANVKVVLLDAAGQAVASAVTGAGGSYSFAGLKPGTYSLKFDPATLPSGMRFSASEGGAVGTDGASARVTLASGEQASFDVGASSNRGTIASSVWEDRNANGVRDSGEAAIAGARVHLFDANGQEVASTTTNAAGNYSFTTDSGSYSVGIDAPAGYGFTEANAGADDAIDSDVDAAGQSALFTLAAGSVIDPADAGLYRAASLSSLVWNDANKNGSLDSGEAGIGGVKVALLDGAGTVVANAVSAADGSYDFGGLKPGAYSIDFDTATLPAGLAFSAAGSDTDADGASGKVVLASGEHTQLQMAAVAQRGSIASSVWEDRNANGVRDSGETAIAGARVHLLGADGVEVGATTTDAAGNYRFTADSGSYSVRIDAPASYQYTAANAGADDTVDSDVDAAGHSSQFVLPAGAAIDPADAGLYRAASLSSLVWNDANKNGSLDSGEAGIGSVKVALLDGAGTVVANAVSAADGSYDFGGLKPGAYSIDFDTATLPAGLAFSAAGSDTDADGASGQVVLASGEHTQLQMAAVSQRGSIASSAWEDRNGNGLRDSGEAAIAGATVHLFDAAGAEVGATTTDAAGNYRFSADSGNYSVRIDAPTGYQFTAANQGADDSIDSDVDAGGQSAAFVLPAGATIDPADAGMYRPASVGSQVWNDANQNGRIDSGEAGIGGVKVALLDASGNVVADAVTSVAGMYEFGGLKPAAYSVKFDLATLPAGVAFASAGSDSDATGATAQVILLSGEQARVQMAAVAQRGTVASSVWEDANANGVRDSGEAAIAGATVRLLDKNGLEVGTATTDAAGNYSFTAAVGSYSVTVDAPAGHTFTTANAGSNDALDSDVDALGRSGGFEIKAGATIDPADAGLYRTASLGDRVWFDTDSDGLQDSLEAGIGGLKVFLLDDSGKTVASTTTDSSGQYTFTNLKPGVYSVQLDMSAAASGYAVTTRNAGADDSRDSDFDATGRSDKITLVSGANNTSLDAGVVALATIGDRVWLDADADGIQDSGEAGVANVAVTLTNASGQAIATTTTDAGGNYKFNVMAGTYSVSIRTPDGHGITKQNIGLDTADSDADASGKLGSVTVKGGDRVTSLDAGLTLASIGNKVWEDADFDGVQDSGEAGIAGLTVRLYDAAHNLKATTVTAGDGSYNFAKLLAGSYSVEIAKPTGYFATKANTGGETVDSDFSNVAGTTIMSSGLVKLAAGEQNANVDAGLYRKASIGDKVWRDANHNGVQDLGEEGIGKIKVALYNATTGALVGSTVTDSGGKYLFSNLDPGSYYLKFDKTNVNFTDSKNLTYAMNNWMWGVKNKVSNDLVDSDVNGDGISKVNTTRTDATFLSSGENDMSWDAAITPIAIDLDGNGIHTIARADFAGKFDLLGTGNAIQSGWLSGGDAFLSIDANGNGRIDDISELFGGSAKGSGFARLASFDSNADGVVNADDAQFGALTVWRDANSNGLTDAGELLTLAEAGVTSLDAGFEELAFLDANNNLHLERSTAIVNGQAVSMTDVYFNVALADALAAGIEVTTMATLVGQPPAQE